MPEMPPPTSSSLRCFLSGTDKASPAIVVNADISDNRCAMTAQHRLNLLLKHLTRRKERSSPKGVGLRTCLQARDLGFVEILGDMRNPKMRLTTIGYAFKQQMTTQD